MKAPCIYIILLLSLNYILLLCELKAITCTIPCRFCWDQFWWGYTSSLWHIQSHAHGWHWCKFPPCLYAIEDLSNTYVHILVPWVLKSHFIQLPWVIALQLLATTKQCENVVIITSSTTYLNQLLTLVTNFLVTLFPLFYNATQYGSNKYNTGS